MPVPDLSEPLPINLLDYVTISPMMRAMVVDCAAIVANAPDPWSLESVEKLLDDVNQWSFVALFREKPIGFACYLVTPGSADLLMLAVHPDFREKGVGRLLLTESLEELKGVGVTRCLLEVRASNKPALALYAKTGFKQLSLREGLYDKPPENGLLLGLNLGEVF